MLLRVKIRLILLLVQRGIKQFDGVNKVTRVKGVPRHRTVLLAVTEVPV